MSTFFCVVKLKHSYQLLKTMTTHYVINIGLLLVRDHCQLTFSFFDLKTPSSNKASTNFCISAIETFFPRIFKTLLPILIVHLRIVPRRRFKRREGYNQIGYSSFE